MYIQLRTALLLFFFFSSASNSDNFNYDKNLSFYLPNSDYENVINLSTKLAEGYSSYENYFVNIKDNEVKSSALFIVSDYLLRENAIDYIGHDDACKIKERIYFKNYIKGSSLNCWRLSVNYPFEYEIDTFGVIFSNIFGNSKSNMAFEIEKYLKKNKIKYEIGLLSTHIYFSKLNQKRYVVAQYYFNPKFYEELKDFGTNDLIQSKNSSSITSYEKNKLKKIIPFFDKLQNNFEEKLNTKKFHKLQILSNTQNKKEIKSPKILKDLLELERLYKSGLIDKLEFEKLKKKLIN